MDHLPDRFKTPGGEARYMAAYSAALGLWPVEHESSLVTTRYGQTHVISCGARGGRPVVLLHGGYASSTMWFPNVAALAREFRVFAIDTIGEPGRSVPVRPNATRGDLADWLVGVLDELRIPTARVVGLSRGGWLALNLAIQASHRVEKIALLSPAASFIALNSFFAAVAGAAMRIPTRLVARLALYSWVTRGFEVKQEFAEQFITGLQGWNWALGKAGYSGVMPSVFSAEDLGRIAAPVLMLIGSEDRLNPPAAIETARRAIPRVQTGIIPHAGHLLSMEQPEIVNARVVRFLCEG